MTSELQNILLLYDFPQKIKNQYIDIDLSVYYLLWLWSDVRDVKLAQWLLGSIQVIIQKYLIL